MYAVQIQFPAGRFHATGWEHHVNEGTVEWPPSPLRLQRALVATGFKLGWEAARIREAVLALQGLPHYRLPRATTGHTRHFMPTGGVPVEKHRTLVFDAFYAFAHDATLGVVWRDADPSGAARADLDQLWRAVAYVGRAESWAVCEPTDDIGEADVVPGAGGLETATLPALLPAEDLARWRESLPKPAKRTWVPADPWEVLLLDTGRVQSSGWSRAPGVQLVDYVLPRAPTVVPARRRATFASPTHHIALFALASDVPPSIERTVSVADRIRRAVMSRTTWLDDTGRRLDQRRDDVDPLVSGRDESGRVLEGHEHAYWLPFASDGASTRLDRLLVRVRAPSGFSPRAVESLRALQKVWGDDQYDLHVVFLGFDADAAAGSRPLVSAARVWVTDTPYVPTRHAKPHKGKDGIGDQVRLELRRLGYPDPAVVEPLPEALHGVPWHTIQTMRRGGGARAMQRGVGVRIVFDEPVLGPIALGWGAHFGMGRFRSV